MQVCVSFFFFPQTRNRDLCPLTSSPARPTGATIPLGGGALPDARPGEQPHSPRRSRAAPWPPRGHPPSPALRRAPARRPAPPGLPGALMPLECGRRGRASGQPPRRPRTAPGERGSAGPRAELAAPAPLTGQERQGQQQPVEHGAEHVRLHARGPAGGPARWAAAALRGGAGRPRSARHGAPGRDPGLVGRDPSASARSSSVRGPRPLPGQPRRAASAARGGSQGRPALGGCLPPSLATRGPL